jgi:uncharacterized protein (DUF2141 family)
MKLFKLLTLSLLGTALAVQAENLTVIVTDLKNNQGEVQVSLYNKDGTIPDKELNKYYKMHRVPISKKEAKVVFKDLPKGRYALNIFHDENVNYKIDKCFFMPKEGVGLSNFETINLFNLPNFKKASFLLNSDKEIQIKVIYF